MNDIDELELTQYGAWTRVWAWTWTGARTGTGARTWAWTYNNEVIL